MRLDVHNVMELRLSDAKEADAICGWMLNDGYNEFKHIVGTGFSNYLVDILDSESGETSVCVVFSSEDYPDLEALSAMHLDAFPNCKQVFRLVCESNYHLQVRTNDPIYANCVRFSYNKLIDYILRVAGVGKAFDSLCYADLGDELLWRLCRWLQVTDVSYVYVDKANALCELLWGVTGFKRYGRVLTIMSTLKWFISQINPELGACFEFEEVVLY